MQSPERLAYTLNHKTLMALQVLRSIGLLEVTPGARVEQVEDGDQPGRKVEVSGAHTNGLQRGLVCTLSLWLSLSLFPCLSVSPI